MSIFRVISSILLPCLLLLTSMVFAGGQKLRPKHFGAPQSLFVKNSGQFDRNTSYLIRSGLFEASFERSLVRFRAHETGVSNELRLSFSCSKAVPPIGETLEPSVYRTYKGSTSETWVEESESFSSIRYADIYPGIDAVFHTSEGRLKADYLIEPFVGDPMTLKLRYSGAKSIMLTVNGGLRFSFDNGELLESPPIAYQMIAGCKVNVEVAFILQGDEVTFRLGAYDRSKQLIIDPALKYATYLGGTETEYIDGIELDSLGNFFVAGHTFSSNFVAKGEQGSSLANPQANTSDVFIAKFDRRGQLVYSTIIGGALNDNCSGFAVDPEGNVYFGGVTANDDPNTQETDGWPIVGNIGREFRYAGGYIAKLDPEGRLQLSGVLNDTFAIGSVLGLKRSVNGRILVQGVRSSHYPSVKIGPDELYSNTLDFALLTPNLEWNEFYRFRYNRTTAKDIAIDDKGAFYFCGNTEHPSLPVTSNDTAFRFTGERSGYIVKIGLDSKVAYALYLGGTGSAFVHNMTLSSKREPTFTGYLNGPRFTAPVYTSLMHDGSEEGTEILYIFQLAADGTKANFLTRVGRQFSAAFDVSSPDIALDGNDEVMITGYSSQASLPLMNALQSQTFGNWSPYILKLNKTGDTVRFGTFLGEGRGHYAVMSQAGTMYAAGHTKESRLPTNDRSHQREYSAGANADDAWIAIIGDTCATTVRTTADAGPNSLRQILECINQLGEPATIDFDIPTSDPGFKDGVYTIQLQSELPSITTSGVTIDGTTQTKKSDSNPNGPEIQLTGSTSVSSLLELLAPFGYVYGLALNNAENGILAASEYALISDCYIGTDAFGTAAVPNSYGIKFVVGAENGLVKNNLISGNRLAGVAAIIDGGSHEIVSNKIGTDRTGMKPIGNRDGINLDNSKGNLIGDSTGGFNLISGNRNGVHIVGFASTNNRIIHNLIGTDTSGAVALSNDHGILLEGDSNTVVGGRGAKYRNIISGNKTTNIAARASNAPSVYGNYIGVDRSGSIGVKGAAPTERGIYIVNSPNASIGSEVPLTRNVISGNRRGITVRGHSSEGTTIVGNLIGLTADGLAEVGNEEDGIQLRSCFNVILGSTAEGGGNVISGNRRAGVTISSEEDRSAQCILWNNFIGTDITGIDAIPNHVGGVILTHATECVIGGDGQNMGNIISGNGTMGGFIGGLTIVGAGSTKNVVLSNKIGVNFAGDPLPNEAHNIVIRSASENQIGDEFDAYGNEIANAASNGILIEKGSSAGSGSGNVILKNNIHDNKRGVFIAGANANYIGTIREDAPLGNQIDSSQQGVLLLGAHETRIIGNNIFNCDTGISLQSSHAVELRLNQLTKSKTAIVASRSRSTDLRGNKLVEQTGNTGLHLYQSDAIALSNGITDDAYSGVVLEQGSTAQLTNNWFSGNKEFDVDARDAASSAEAELNWWGNITGPVGRINGNVDAEPWMLLPPRFSAIAIQDTLFVGVNDSASVLMGAISLDGSSHTVNVLARAENSLVHYARTAVQLNDMIGSAIRFKAPSTPSVTEVQYIVSEGGTTDTARAYVATYLPEISSLQLVPDTMHLEPGMDAKFRAMGFDQHDHAFQPLVQWASPDLTVSTDGGFTAPNVSGIYKVIASQDGYLDTGIVEVGEPVLWVKKERLDNPTLVTYPNPATQVVTITMPTEAHDGTISIIGLDGKEVDRSIVSNGNRQIEIDTRRFSPGSYQVILTSDMRTWSSPLTVVR